jgi:hypothetical protein
MCHSAQANTDGQGPPQGHDLNTLGFNPEQDWNHRGGEWNIVNGGRQKS